MVEDPRYADINNVRYPAASRVEVERAVKRIFGKFGRKELGSVNQTMDCLTPAVRRCWISLKPTSGNNRGWGRLIHDSAHIIFRKRHPSFRPHAAGHEVLERQILISCQVEGFLDGKLAPKAKPKLTTLEKRQKRLREIEAGIIRWNVKMRRGTNAIKKLVAEQYRIRRAIENGP